MELFLDKPDYEYFLRSANGDSALVNERRLGSSFVIAPDVLIEDWPVREASALRLADLEAIFALEPS